VIDALGYGHSREFVLEEPSWLTAMNEYYKHENLSDIKDYLIVSTLRGTVNLLDREARDFAVEQSNAVMGSEGSIPDDKLAYEMTDGWLSEAVGRMWAEKYATSKTKSDIEKMIGEVIAYYRDMLTRETWLSPETREKAINKLDHVTVRAAYPNKWEDFSELDFKGADEGGSLVDAAWSISRFELSRDVKLVNTKTDREKWNLSPSIVNAFYSPLDNSINIPAGILGGVFYNPDAPREENLGAIGVIIGHELTHAFDTNGSQYDESGNMKNWWNEEDKEAFQKRADTVIQYFGTLDAVPGVKVDGELIHTEAIADLGGLGCMTAIGRKASERGEPFDFAKFYEAFARVWRNKSTKETEEYKVKLDVHPLAFIRTNTSVQMQPEFYEAFGIKEGDGMYLAPEKRVSVW
ncbi:MAG: M13 family metallopeptidase, partial [Synergistes sp.]|nr:M13 family metallopeptidase [Synergistes sp.]